MDDKLDYFIEQTNRKLDKIDHQLEELINFRLILIGSAATVSVIFSVITTIIMIIISK
jgi:hypothetical protein